MARNAPSAAVDHHGDLFQAAVKQFQALFDESPQGMYLYMDDVHKACNERFAKLLGYRNAAEWNAVLENIPAVFVHDPKDIDLVIDSFQDCIGKGVGAVLDIPWRRKDGKPVPARTIMVPYEQDGHRMALHFIQPR